MSAVSRAIGEGNIERARRHGASAILMGLCAMTVVILCLFAIAPLFLWFTGQSAEVRAMAMSYLIISFPGLIIVSVASMSNNILRASGEAALPSSIMILGAVINIILDPFFIFGWGPFPRLEVQGAAIATVIGNCIAAVFGFYLVRFHRKAISFTDMTRASLIRAWKIIGRVALPAVGTNVIVPICTYVVVVIIGRTLTQADVAAFTVVSRAELISVGLLYALSACIGAITGRNGGAGNTSRVRETFKTCYWICVIWSTLMALIMFTFAPQIAGLFTNDAVLIEKIIPYFHIVPITIFAYGFVFVSAAGLNALGRPIYGLVYTIIRSCFLYISLIGIGVHFAGLTGAFWGMAAANLISGFIAFGWTMTKVPMTAQKS